MGDRSRSQTLVRNERIKALSGVAFNSGTALMIAAVVRCYNIGTMDWTAFGWSVVTFVVMFAGYKSLLLLESEE